MNKEILTPDGSSLVAAYRYTPWMQQGIGHLFTGVGTHPALDPRSATVLLFKQVHGDKVIVLEEFPPPSEFSQREGDAVFFSSALAPHFNTFIGVKTADCVPLLVASTSHRAVIHAGWRGLANQIIRKTLNLFIPGEPISLLIGPCAGPECYEVGVEITQQIGSASVFKDLGHGKQQLDLRATAHAQIVAVSPSAEIRTSAFCTVCSPQFHSHRRDRERSGRNLALFELSPS